MSTEVCDLRQGDVVALVGETDQGLIRGRACVLGQTAPDWYEGELEDGSRIEFRIDQVEGVETEYGMSGFLDWFKKKPVQESRALIPTGESEGIIFVGPTGVAKYEEPKPAKKGFLKPIAEAVKAFFTSSQGGSSVFDIFKTTTALIPEPEKEAVKFEKAASIFSQFVPPEKSLETIAEKISALIPPEGPGPLAPYIEAAERTFEHIKPSAPIVPYEEQKARQMEVWEGMFEESKEEAPLYEAFAPGTKATTAELRPFEESEVVREEDIEYPETYESGHALIAEKWLPMPARNTMLPTVDDTARGLLGWVRPDFFDHIREQSAKNREMGDRAFKIPFETIGRGDGSPDYMEGISIFLQIPWEEFRKRAVIAPYGDGEEEWVGVDKIYEEIIYPAYGIITDAFDLIKPADLPGRFRIGEYDAWGPQSIIYYEEVPGDLSEEELEEFEETGELSEELDEEEEPVLVAHKLKPKKKSKAKKKKAKVKVKAR